MVKVKKIDTNGKLEVYIRHESIIECPDCGYFVCRCLTRSTSDVCYLSGSSL